VGAVSRTLLLAGHPARVSYDRAGPPRAVASVRISARRVARVVAKPTPWHSAVVPYLIPGRLGSDDMVAADGPVARSPAPRFNIDPWCRP
jgi:hypothetical protein